jgi:hypothetical protein
MAEKIQQGPRREATSGKQRAERRPKPESKRPAAVTTTTGGDATKGADAGAKHREG